MTDVSGRWALVTGASRGIGFLAAECLARNGCNLILHSRREEHLDKIVKAATTCGVQVRTVAAELSNITDMEDMLRLLFHHPLLSCLYHFYPCSPGLDRL